MKTWIRVYYLLLSFFVSVSLMSLLTREIYESSVPLLYDGATLASLSYNKTIEGFKIVGGYGACSGVWSCAKTMCEIHSQHPHIYWIGIASYSKSGDPFTDSCANNNWVFNYNQDFKPEIISWVITTATLLLYYILFTILLIRKTTYSVRKFMLSLLFKLPIYVLIGIIYGIDVRNVSDSIPLQLLIPENFAVITLTFVYTLDSIVAPHLLFSEEEPTTETESLLIVN